MEAARVAAIEGHKVTLFEKNSKLGGVMGISVLQNLKIILKNSQNGTPYS